MSRPKANTPEGKRAIENWKKTMTEKYGSISEKMREVGRIGGMNGYGPDYRGGFAYSHEIASKAGAMGGYKSRRGFRFIKELNEKEALYKNLKTNEEVVLQYGVSIHEKQDNMAM